MTKKTGFFKRLKALELPQKKLFAIALCQRMLPNYQLFSEVCEFGDPAVLSTVLELLWQSQYDNKLKFNIDVHLQRLEDNTPDPADFDSYGVYPAMDAVVANISKLSSSTVANYIETISDVELTDDALDDYVFAHEVMEEERALQNTLLEIIEENPKITAELVKGLRKEIIEAGVSNIGISVA